MDIKEAWGAKLILQFLVRPLLLNSARMSTKSNKESITAAKTATHALSSTDSNGWSSHGKTYNGGQTKPLTYAAIKTCFDLEVFTLLDDKFSSASSERKLQILTLASGTGSELLVLLDRYGVEFLRERCEILATDYAQGMVDATKELMESLGASDFVRVQKMDAQNISLASDSQDVVLFMFGPMMLPNPVSSLSSILRVLKQGGLSAYISPSSMDFYGILDDCKSSILRARGLTRETDSQFAWSFYDNRAIAQWGRPEAVEKHFLAAEYVKDKVNARMVEVKVEIDDWRQTNSSLKSNPGMSYFWKELTDAEADVFWDLIDQRFRERYGEDGRCEMKQGVVLSWAWK